MAQNIIVINVDLRETRVALIQDGVIAELHIERAAQRGTVGNVVLGKVTRVLPGMQAAFIDVGQERAAFLHVEDLIRPQDFDAYLEANPSRAATSAGTPASTAASTAETGTAEGPESRGSGRGRRRRSRRGRGRASGGERPSAFADAERDDQTSTGPEAFESDDGTAGVLHGDDSGLDLREDSRPDQELPSSPEGADGDDPAAQEEELSEDYLDDDEGGLDLSELLDLDEEDFRSAGRSRLVVDHDDDDSEEGDEEGIAEDEADESRSDEEDADDDEADESRSDEEDADDDEAAEYYPDEAEDVDGTEEDSENERDLDLEDDADDEAEFDIDELEDDVDVGSEAESDDDIDVDSDAPGADDEDSEDEDSEDEDSEDEDSEDTDDGSGVGEDEPSADGWAATGDAEVAGRSAAKRRSLASTSVEPNAAPTGQAGEDDSRVDDPSVDDAAASTGYRRRRRRRRRGSTAEVLEAKPEPGPAEGVQDNPNDDDGSENGRGRRRRRRRRGKRSEAEVPSSPVAAPKAAVTRVPARVSRSVPITEVVKEGDHVVVQITKEPIGTKGARVTSHVSLPGRYVVYLPTVEHTGISKRIGQGRERSRLRKVIDSLKPATGGLIVRTVAEGLTKKQLKADVGYLIKVWAEIAKKRKTSKAREILYEELDLVLKVARDYFVDEVVEVVIDDKEQYGRLVRFVEMFMPARAKDIKLYTGDEPIFDAYGIEDEIKRALSRKVPLPSGGSLIMDQAEALTAVDVNTGRYVGKGSKDLEETALKTNLEAVDEIAQQLRFRNIGGLVILDLIDMERAENRERVWRALEQKLAKDKAKTTINRISDLGLIEMTRKRTRESLGRIMHESCFYCDGTGHIQSRETIAYEILRQIRRDRHLLPGYSVKVNAHPAVVDFLKFEAKDALVEAERRYMRRIELVPRQEYHIEQYDMQGR